MAQVISMRADMFPAVYDALLRHHDRRVTRRSWERLINYRSGGVDSDCGFALVDGSELVGFHGMLLTERRIGRRHIRFCNLHTWIVKESHRGDSLALLRPILRLRGYTLTDMTPSRSVYRLLRRLGFADLDSQILFLLPTLRSDRGGRRVLESICDPDRLRQLLDQQEVALLEGHACTPSRHVAFVDGRRHCFLIYSVVCSHWFRYCYIHYCGNSEMFERHQGRIRAWLMKQCDCWFIAIDSRLARGITLAHTQSFPLHVRKVFRSDELQPDQVDNLYTELSIGGLSGLPNFSDAVWRRAIALLRRSRPGGMGRVPQ